MPSNLKVLNGPVHRAAAHVEHALHRRSSDQLLVDRQGPRPVVNVAFVATETPFARLVEQLADAPHVHAPAQALHAAPRRHRQRTLLAVHARHLAHLREPVRPQPTEDLRVRKVILRPLSRNVHGRVVHRPGAAPVAAALVRMPRHHGAAAVLVKTVECLPARNLRAVDFPAPFFPTGYGLSAVDRNILAPRGLVDHGEPIAPAVAFIEAHGLREKVRSAADHDGHVTLHPARDSLASGVAGRSERVHGPEPGSGIRAVASRGNIDARLRGSRRQLKRMAGCENDREQRPRATDNEVSEAPCSQSKVSHLTAHEAAFPPQLN